MPTRSASYVIGQVILCGQVLGQDTGRPIPGYTVRLLDRGVNPAVEIALADYGLSLRRSPAGLFGFFGVPEMLSLAKAQQHKWRLEVSAPGYATLVKNFQFTLPAAQPEPVEFIRPIPGDAISVRLFRAGLPLDLGELKPVKLPD